MGERDDRIDALKRAEGSARSGLGGVEQKYQSELNAPGDAARDAQIAALTGQRNALQEQLAKVEGELSELQRGWDAERKTSLGGDAQESKQQISASDQQRADDAIKADPSKQGVAQQVGTSNQQPDSGLQAPTPDRGSSGGAPQSIGQSGNGSSGSSQGSATDRSDDKPPQAGDKGGFPPFEKSDRAPGGFDWKDISNEPVNFQKVDPNDENFPGGQAKSPTSNFKPYSEVLHNSQVAGVEATMEQIQRDAAAAQQLKSSLNLDKTASDGFDRAQFESGAHKLNEKFAEQDRQREQFGSNTLIDSNQAVVDRETQLERWDTTRQYCRGEAERELDDLKTQLRSEVGAERQRLEANDASMMALYGKKVAGQADEKQRLADYDKMLSESRDQQLDGFKALKDKEFTMAVEDRADVLQQQHFPEVYENGPKQYFPPVPTLSIGEDGGNSPGSSGGGPPTPPGGGGGGAPALAPQQTGPGGGSGAAPAMAQQQQGPPGPGM